MKPALRFLLAMTISAAAARSQTSTTQLSGTVYDNTKAVVVGAVVTALNEGTGAALRQTTNSAGLFAFPSIGIGAYTITVEMPGFKTARRTGIILVVGTPQTADMTLDLGDTHEVVKVEAEAEAVNTTSATLGNVVEQKAVSTLPLNGRNPLNLIVLEPGVTQRNGFTISVNGSRGQAGNVTIDGIEANEASSPTPTNNVYRINQDSVEEFKVTTSNATPEEGRNSGLNVSMATRSGTNQFHGTLIEYFRNSNLNSNEFFANAQGNSRPIFKSNQYGYEVGGPIRKNRTFFFNGWQGQKVNLTGAIDKAFGHIPLVYTPTALNGIYRYFVSDPNNPLAINGVRVTQNSPNLVTAAGALAPGIRSCGSPTDLNCVQSYNIFASDPLHIGGDPAVLKQLRGYPAPNTFNTGDGLNVAGYLWNTPAHVRGPRNILRIDHIFNERNNVFFRAMWATEQQLIGDFINSSPSVFPGYPPKDEVYRPAENYAFSWRRVISPSTVNELTLGFARFTFLFTDGTSNPNYPKNLPAYTFNNVDVDYNNTPQTRRTLNTPQIIDNLSWTRGAHQFKFGVNMRFYQMNNLSGSVGGANVAPAISLSSSINPPGAAFGLPAVASSSASGISSTDYSRLLSSINDLLGIPATLKQVFIGNLSTNTIVPPFSGDNFSLWVQGIRAKQFNAFWQDEWKLRPNLTVTYGVRWEYNRPPTGTAHSVFVPDKAVNGSQGLVTFVPASGYFPGNNLDAFAPRLGIGWSPDRNRTVVRAGYGLAFDPLTPYQASAAANTVPGVGYSCTAPVIGQATAGCASVQNLRLSQGFPQSLAVPNVQPSSFLSPPPQLLNNSPNIVVFDPHMKMATVHQWNISIQRELPGGFVIQTGYVGNRGERLYSSWDANQIGSGPILPSFLALQSNLQKGCQPDGSNCPAGAVATQAPIVAGGIVTSAFVNSSATVTDLKQNAAGNFAGRIEQTTLAAHLRPNQQFGTITYLSNGADSVYHGLQTTVRKRFGAGLLLNLAYTFSKVIDDQSGDPVGTSYTGGLSVNSAPVDDTNLHLDRGRADFNQKHALTLTWIYELPFGKGKPLLGGAPGFVQALIGGWSLQGLNSYLSGEPFSVVSGARTANYSSVARASLAGPMPGGTLNAVPGVVGPAYFQNASAFTLAAPGSTGMGRNLFDGPYFWDVDAAMSKSFRFTERMKLTLRMEAFNALNRANFRNLKSASVGSTSILSPNFGLACCQTQSTSTSTAIVSNGEAYRVVQFVLRLGF